MPGSIQFLEWRGCGCPFRNGTFVFLAIDAVPDYLGTAALPAPGVSTVWKYKAIYRLNDEPVGQWSDVASVSVMG